MFVPVDVGKMLQKRHGCLAVDRSRRICHHKVHWAAFWEIHSLHESRGMESNPSNRASYRAIMRQWDSEPEYHDPMAGPEYHGRKNYS